MNLCPPSSVSRRLSVLCLLSSVLCLTGCSIWPSSWRLFGTPVDKEKKTAEKIAQTTGALDQSAQRAVHEAAIALASAPDSKPVAVARDFVAEAQALMDQAHGSPGVANLDAWQKLVADAIAGNTQALDAQRAENATLSAQLTKEQAAHAHAIGQLAGFAEENAGLADWVRKLALGALCIVLFIVATHLVGLAAHLNPASALLGGAATTMTSVLSAGSVLAVKSAKDGLARVGAGLALIRQKLPAVAADVTSYLDATTASHPQAQAAIAAGAAAAGSPPTS